MGIKVGAQKTHIETVGMAIVTGLLHSGLSYSKWHVLTKEYCTLEATGQEKSALLALAWR